jgi:peptidoglycan/LPS O-acetylase OafA/YrhL
MREQGRAETPRLTAHGIPIVPAIDGFRAFSLLAVVFVHMLGLSGVLIAIQGTPGGTVVWGLFGNVIDVFFIISGFGLFLAVVTRRGSVGRITDYALNRGARILPGYWLCVLVLLVLLAVDPPDPDRVMKAAQGFPSGRDIFIHLTVLQMPARMLDAGLPVGFGIDGSLWMVSVIVGFYVLFPFIARPYYRHPLIGLAIAAAISLGWREAAIHADGLFTSIEGGSVPAWLLELIVTDQLPAWLFSFALGMTGAWAYVRLQQSGPDPGRVTSLAGQAAAVGLVACAICSYLYGKDAAAANAIFAGSTARSDPVLALLYSASRAVLIAGVALGPLWMQRPFSNRPVRRLAELGYSTYLIPVPIAIYVGILLLDLPSDGTAADAALWLAVVVPLSLAYAALAVRFVERPAREWARRRTAARPARGADGGGGLAGPLQAGAGRAP